MHPEKERENNIRGMEESDHKKKLTKNHRPVKEGSGASVTCSCRGEGRKKTERKVQVR